MSTNVSQKTIIVSLLWKFAERMGVQVIQFIVQIILARLLLPEEFGLIVIVLVFLNIANVFVQNGFNTALVQKKDTDTIDYSSIFYLNLIVAALMYIILFVAAPWIAQFFNDNLLINVIKVLALTLFLGAILSVQNAILTKNMQFKKQFISVFIASLISGIISIFLAYFGFGVWTLVIQQLMSQAMMIVILFLIMKWRPELVFSMQRIKVLFSFGWKLLLSSLIDTIYSNSRNLIVGKMYTADVLAYYNRGEQLPGLIVTNVSGTIQSVIFPALVSYQDDKIMMKKMVRRAITLSCFVIFPLMVGLAATAESVVILLLTEKWLEAVPFIQIACIYFCFWPIHVANLQAINAMGRSDVFLKLEIIKKIVGIVILIATIPFGVYVIAWGMVISNIIGMFINAFPNRKLLNYSYLEQVKDIMPAALISVVMGGSILFFNFIEASPFLKLSIQVVIGVLVYGILAKMFKLESLKFILSLKNM